MIGHYRIVESIGSGAMGTVQIAVDTYIDRSVAIKSLRPELTSDPDFVSRFRGEAKSLARLNHPNIATLFSPIIDGSDMHLVMELVRGKALDEILRDRGRPLGVRESLAIVAQAADGLSYAHEMGVIHRDIKPANLMIADDGRVKIMDFGIARVQGSVRLTRSGTAVGTPLYMSPEQCRGGEGDERSDIYSLAIVLYEMLRGAPPFTAETEYDLIQAQIATTPAPLVPRIAGVSPTLEAAVLKALAKKPEQRFETMRAFSDALGATALRPDATGMIRNAAHLIEARQEPAESQARTGAFDVVKSRLLGFSRGWRALGVGSKAGIAVVAAALLAGGAYLAKPDGEATPTSLLSPSVGRALTLSDLRLAISGSSAEAIRAGDFDLVSNGIKAQLLEPVRKLADAGSAEALFVLGMLLSETPGHIDRQKAFAAFNQSANQNYAEAQAVLGSLYQDGQAPEGRNLQKAAEWYERAAERGNGKAAFWLGCYDQFGWGGRGVNPQKAIADYSKAIAGHYPKATEALQAMSGGSGARSPCK
jgi:serine/threonine-protein kinase